MNAFFSELGQMIRGRWQAQNFSPDAFPGIATAALQERSPAANVDVEALIHEFLLEDEQPLQSASGFGQPELIVFDDPRFYIQVLFWLEGTTDIHQHKFSGAFHVLAGSSIHAHFEFERPERITAHFRLGELRMRQIRLLETGSTEAIHSGPGFIHSLFHLDTPSLTVVVRTHTDPGTGPQFTYLPPHLAVDPFQDDALTRRRNQLLDVLEQTGDERYPEIVREMLRALDFERGFFTLQNGMGHLRALGEWDDTWAVFAEKHGRLAEYVASTLEQIVQRDRLVEMRRSVTDTEHRFFLALLLSAPTRADLLGLVAQRFEGPPEGTTLRWAEELCTESPDGAALLLDAEFPADLDVPLEEQAEMLLSALDALLNGRPAAPSAAEHMPTLRAVLQASSLHALTQESSA